MIDLEKEGLKVTFNDKGVPQVQNMLPYNPMAMLGYASQLCMQGKHKEGIRLLLEAVEVDDCRKIACVNLANAYLDVLDIEKALEYGLKSLKMFPHDGFVHQTLYKIYIKCGDIKQAEKHLIWTRILTPESEELPELETDIYAYKDQLDEYNKRLGGNLSKKILLCAANAPFYFEIVQRIKTKEQNPFYSQELIDSFSESTDVIQEPIFIYPYDQGFLKDLGYQTRPYTGKTWKGEDLTGKSILIYSEQGLGDNIWLFGFIKKLKKKYGCYIKLATYHQLHCIAEKCDYIDKLLRPAFSIEELVDVDYVTSIFSLLQFLPINWQGSWLPKFTHLQLPSSKTHKKKVVVNWLCKANLQKFKPINLELLSSVLHHNANKCEFFACQRDLFAEKMNEDIKRFDLPVTPVLSSNLDDMFAFLCDADLVFTIDTLHVHAAGGLGKKTTLLLTKNLHLPTWGLQSGVPYYGTVKINRDLKSLLSEDL